MLKQVGHLTGPIVVKILGHSEKPENIGRIGKVHHVHPPLYKNSIGVRGTFMAPNKS